MENNKNNKSSEIRTPSNGIENREITAELKESYLDYAMSVIVSRALPDVRDGLKPVHRRILWSMWDSGLRHTAKFKKSANVVGEVLGKYHPHGDQAVYDSMVRMAQDFSLRYPLIEGQGNFGSIDGDSAAAYRYTEARLSKIADEMMIDIEKESVDWQPTYDGARQEPKVLPARLPNLLLNGTVGIAVGMATNIPPHNLNEIADAALHLIDNSKATSSDLMRFVQGPDFPTGGIIYDKKAIAEAYATGRGSITTRATAEIKEGGKQFIIEISSIPYQVNKSELLIKIAELVTEKKIEGIRDVRDESDREGLRIVIELKNDAVPQKILNQLYQHTDLQKNFNLNMIALIDGLQPRLLSLKEILQAYIDHRKEIVRKRTEFDLKKAEERAHILIGLAKALSIIDKVISTIKKSKDREDAHKNLIKNFKFTDVQATAILEMKLQTLANLEQQKIEDELKEKKKLIAELQLLLKSPAKILTIIKNELKELKDKYGGERKTKVIAGGLKEFKQEDLIPKEETVITLSKGGYIKRMAPTAFRSQQRGGKGLIGSEVAEEDFLTHFVGAITHDNILFFTDKGRVFQTKVYEIPAASRTAKGKPIQNFLQVPTQENITTLITYSDDMKKNGALMMITNNGMVKKTLLEGFENVRRNGIIAISLKKGDLLQKVNLVQRGDHVIVTSTFGQAIRFKESQIRPMGRTAAGVRAIRLKKDHKVASMDVIAEEKTKDKKINLMVVMANGFGKQTPLINYKVQNRGGSGIKTAKITSKTGALVSAHLIDEQEELLALSAKGQIIRTKIVSVRVTGRDAQGVKIMTLTGGDKLIGVICL